MSGRAGAPRGPRRSLYISGLPSPLTRQAVSATFSRSVASESCQRKQRARFVKPKVKLRSNEGTVPPRRHLRHHPATGSEGKGAAGGGRGLNVKRRSRAEPIRAETSGRNLLRSKQPRRLQRRLGDKNATCLIRDVATLMFKCGCAHLIYGSLTDSAATSENPKPALI